MNKKECSLYTELNNGASVRVTDTLSIRTGLGSEGYAFVASSVEFLRVFQKDRKVPVAEKLLWFTERANCRERMEKL